MKTLKDIVRTNSSPEGNYCFECGSSSIRSEKTPEGEYFICDRGHRLPRVYLFDKKTIQHIEDDVLIHETVAAIIKRRVNKQSLTLLFLRRKFPFQYTIPAGHLEHDETPTSAVKREVEEETGLIVTAVKPLYQSSPPKLFDPCRRGADYHYWHLFSVDTDGEPQLSDEGRIIGWYTDNEIKTFKKNRLLTQPLMKLLD